MRVNNNRRARMLTAWLMVLALFAMPMATLAQTRISYHSNKYKISDDVRAGQQAAAEVERQMPIMRDAEVTDYINRIGQRLVAAIPPEFQQPEFRYYFKVVDARDINAFALPGGPMYINRGMIQAARSEGEMAGVMAHELSHVALRHGTAQATKAQKYSILSGIAGIAGSIIGGPALGQVGQAAVGTYFLKFSREYETEADILGAQILARAGYDPREMANMFKTIEAQGGRSGPEWMSSHPNPGNRYNAINQEASMLRVSDPTVNTQEFT
ncbi:MAG: M48 family metalloprotease, partial [Pyrinomonadaceae bacterium]|nr:M48 family metalloprotease [Pyrinomonadaceae bacterium]